jgi:anthranilate phosphoribosyltransferase
MPDRPGPKAVLAKLGIPTELDAKQATDHLETKGFAYLDVALYHPPVARFLELRQELGLRNLFNPVVKMLNPARAQSQVIGVSHPPYLEKTIEALKMLGCPRALVLRGVEGDPELSLATVTKVVELRDERVTALTLRANDIGMSQGSFREMAGFPRAHLDKEAVLLHRILSHEVSGGPRDWVLMNAAMLLYAAGKAPSISAAIPLATRAVESGAAARKLKELAVSPAAESSGGGSHVGQPKPQEGLPPPSDVSHAEALAS